MRAFDDLSAHVVGLASVSTRRARRATRIALGVAAAMAIASSASARPDPRATVSACTPVMLCPVTGGAGAGAGGAGTGGAGGRGGAGGVAAGGSGGGGVPAGGIVVSVPLALDRTSLSAGQTLRGSVTYRNTSSKPITLSEVRIAARAPGATHAGGPYTDLAPALSNSTIAAGASLSLEAARTFTTADPLGQWEAYSTYLDASGAWHDAPSVHFDVVAGSGSGGGGSNPAPIGAMSAGTQEWFIASWSGANIWRSGIDWSTAYASGAEVWRTEFLTELAGYSVFRHMDTNAVNHSRIAHWSQRKLPTDPRNAEIYIDGGSSADTTGMAIEWQIDLCNRGFVDCWFTHPYLADDDYLRQEATLIKAKLHASLRVYIELSNEVWNGSFRQYQQAIDAGNSGGLPGSNQYYKGIAHELHRALAMYSIYREVFGDAAMGTRVVRVFSESGNLDLTTQALANVYRSPQWNPRAESIDMIALAPYIGNGQDGATEKLSRWKSEVDSKVSGQPITYALDHHVRPYGIKYIGCYEAGMHHLQNADVWARNPDAYDAYTYMLDRFASKLNAPCVLYTLHGQWKPDGAWGLYAAVGQSISQAPKARGARDWMAGTVVASTTAQWIVWLVLVLLLLVVVVLAVRVYSRAAQRAAAPPPAPEPPLPDEDPSDAPPPDDDPGDPSDRGAR